MKSDEVPIVLCGDFNSLPDSGVVEFLQSGKVSASHSDFKELPYTKSLAAFGHGLRSNNGSVQDPQSITHPFKYNSCYNAEHLAKLRYTNITYEFKGIIDYIFYSRTQLICLGVLSGIDPAWFTEHHIVGCPHPHVPSDHLPLVTEFQLLPPGYQPNQQQNHQQLQQSNNTNVGQVQNSYPPNNQNHHPNSFHNHHQYSRYFNAVNQLPGGVATGYQSSNTASTMGSNGNNAGSQQQQQQQQSGQQRYPTTSATSRPGSANMLCNSPINIPNGSTATMSHMNNMGLGLNPRR